MSSRLTDLLHCDLPIQLAPMGSVSATPSLPLAVAAAGGHAMYPALALPPPPLEPVLDALAEKTDAFGVNFIVPFMDRASLELAVQRAPYVDFFLADPDPALVGIVHAAGATCGWQVETAREARAAEAAGCDVVIAKAWESGGRKRVEGPTLMALLDSVLDAIGIPVIAAGGIATARGVAAAFAMGADGVRVGTRFIAATEADAHPAWVRAVVDAAAEDAVVSEAFNVGLPEPGPHRVLRSSIAAAEALTGDEAGVVRLAGAEIPVPRFGAQPPTRDSSGAVEAMPFYAGQSAGAVGAVQPAAEIVRELAAGLP
ncbi:MAG TPA: nitronate monooxygenase [Solirubrobacteraceae bacterium]|jgi:NAD(P)H-dependent flavin oxidoreductase YrpB (nitropropane dioxygenase family)